MVWLFWILGGFLAYTFVGYPLCLWVVSRVRTNLHHRASILPTITVIIPAHNEGALLRDKILNVLEAAYPDDKKEVIVASDASRDETLEIVRSFADRGVRLVESPARVGKHHVQMLARDVSCGEILVFTDAGVQLEHEALQQIVSNFADPSVGCVSSEDAVVLQGSPRYGESAYVNFEMWLRRLESQVNSLVSASGSFFAARRELCDVWHPQQSSDFFIPLHAAKRHFRVVVDPQCRGLYGLTKRSDAEFHRKVRTIVHGLDVLFTHRELLNPFRYPMFSWQLVSHKLFRWLVPFAMVALLTVNALLLDHGPFYRLSFTLQVLMYGAGALALLWNRLLSLKPFKLAGFFLLGNLATIAAWLKFCLGEKFVAWQPTHRG